MIAALFVAGSLAVLFGIKRMPARHRCRCGHVTADIAAHRRHLHQAHQDI